MALTVTYNLANRVAPFVADTSIKAGTQTDPVAFALASGTYLALWSTPNPTTTDVDANNLSTSGTSLSSGEFRANATDDVTGNQFDPAVAQILTGPNAGKILEVYTDAVGVNVPDIRLVQLNSNGTPPTTSTLVWSNGNFGKVDSAIAALSNGGFVVSFSRLGYGPGGPDGTSNVVYAVYDSSLAQLPGPNFVERSNVSGDSSVAGLTGGGFVVAWEETPTGGGAKTVWFQRYDNAGTPTGVDVNDPDGTHIQIGSATSTALADIQVKGLADGGFVVAYVVNNGATGNDIVAQVFNANGTARTGTLNVNTTTAGDQDKPSIALLPGIANGLFAVSWTDESTHQSGYRLFNATTGAAAGAETFIDSNVVKNSITANGSTVVSVFESTTSESGGSGDSIQMSVQQVVRTTIGTGATETITGDSLRDVINGLSGNDTITGGGNSDTFVFTETGGNGPTAHGTVITDYDQGNSGTYNASEGDVIDLSAYLAGPYNHGSGLPLASIARVANIGGSTVVQVNINDASSNWQTAAILQHVTVGETVSVLVDPSLAPFTLTVDSPPVSVAFSNLSIPENTTAVTSVHTTDPDGDALTYAIRPTSADGALFQVDSNGVLSFKTAPDFENPTDNGHDNVYNLTVRISDGHETTDAIVQVTVTDVAETTHWMQSVAIGAHPAGWLPTSFADFSGDGTSDVFWYNATNHDAETWKIGNGQWAGSVDIGNHPAGYNPIGPGDFNHDGTSDMLWVNPSTLDTDIWMLGNGGWIGSTTIGAHPAGYQAAGIGDFNHDGTSDVFWFNPSNSATDIWLVNNGQWAGSTSLGNHPAGYQVAGVGDFNHDGTSDILWVNPANNATDIWLVNNGQWAGSTSLGNHPLGYQVAGIGDFNQDGTSDVVWYNPTTNDVDIWLVQNGQWAGSVSLGAHPAGSTLMGVGDFDHNGVSDIMWRDTNTGAIETWLIAYS